MIETAETAASAARGTREGSADSNGMPVEIPDWLNFWEATQKCKVVLGPRARASC